MTERRNQEGQGNWAGMRPHEEFVELCAIATSGDLSPQEERELRGHLATCAECRQALGEFEAVVGTGIPPLASALYPPRSSQARRNGHSHTPLNWNYVGLSLASGVVLALILSVYSFRAGQQRGFEAVRVASLVADSKTETLERQLSDMEHERETIRAQGAERDRILAGLRRRLEQESAALEEMKSTNVALERSLQADDTVKQRAAEERDAALASVRTTQGDLDSLLRERTQDQARYAALEGQIKNLNAELQGREQTIDRQAELLAHDRDIRDLMGARDLYIAEVYDVARDGATQKPYGRVFYTKGKSLIFYAYDLDGQPGVRAASTFQAWGRRGTDKQRAVNLGIFYEDNLAKKRWVLKSTDPKTLEQIDAVFVTVEPSGGSQHPSGKSLLFAFLQVDANHP